MKRGPVFFGCMLLVFRNMAMEYKFEAAITLLPLSLCSL